MIDLKAFRKANELTQKDLAEYLGVHHSFIATGRSLLPDEQLDKILSNNKGWDLSMLRDPGTSIMTHASGNSNGSVNINSNNAASSLRKRDIEIASLKKENEYLKLQLAEEKERSAQYWEMIQKLMK